MSLFKSRSSADYLSHAADFSAPYQASPANPGEGPRNVLIVEDSDFDAMVTKELLERSKTRQYNVKRVSSLEAARIALSSDEDDIDVVLVDMGLPDSEGLTTVREILAECDNLPVIVLTGQEETALALQTINLGAQDYLPKSQLNDKILQRVIDYSVHRYNMQGVLREKAYTDYLTGVMNRSYLYERWNRMVARAQRAERQIGLVLIDLDDFKAVNDEYGHDVGDGLLMHIANELESSVRITDMVARLGGDEFVIVFENVDGLTQLSELSEKVKLVLRDTYIHDGHRIDYSATIGTSLSEPKEREELMAVIKRADQDMYSRKEVKA